MDTPFLTFAYLILPFLGAVVALIILLLCFKKEHNATKLKFSLGFGIEFLSFERELPINVWVLRLLFSSISLVLSAYPSFRDYSSFFPIHYQMEVFFDNDGLERALTQFTSSEIQETELTKNWKVEKAKYFSNLNDEVKRRFGNEFRFDERRGFLQARGETSFVVKKVKHWGLQKYKIEKAEGKITHIYQTPTNKSYELNTEFKLLETDANFIEVSLFDIYLRWITILRPEFKQTLTSATGREYYYHNIIALTKIRFFPIIDISKTIYLTRSLDGKLIPVGYAIYNHD